MTENEASFILANIDRRVCDDELSDALEMAIKALEQQPCEDAISRQAVLNMKRLFIDEDGVMAYAVPTGNILRLPSVQSTRPTGKWIDIGNEGLVFKCSLCGDKNTIESHYCPNCGADMRESEGEE